MTVLPASEITLPPAPVQPPRLWELVLRALVAVGIAVGLVQAATEPVQRSVDELLVDLQDGRVHAVTLERPPSPDTYEYYSGTLRVEWDDGGVQPAWATYTFEDGSDVVRTDEGREILRAVEASPRTVDLALVDQPDLRSGVTWNLSGIAMLAALIMLVAGPQPRLATKWAWFWLGLAVPPLALAWVVLEPAPLWARRPLPYRARRLTGGWALLIAIAVAPLATSAWVTLAAALSL